MALFVSVPILAFPKSLPGTQTALLIGLIQVHCLSPSWLISTFFFNFHLHIELCQKFSVLRSKIGFLWKFISSIYQQTPSILWHQYFLIFPLNFYISFYQAYNYICSIFHNCFYLYIRHLWLWLSIILHL